MSKHLKNRFSIMDNINMMKNETIINSLFNKCILVTNIVRRTKSIDFVTCKVTWVEVALYRYDVS